MHGEVAPVHEAHSFGAAKHPADLAHEVRLRREGRETQGQARKQRDNQAREFALIHDVPLASAPRSRVVWTARGHLS